MRLIYVISDLHLGGEPDPPNRGFRICTHEVELANFIDAVTAVDAPSVELVINGDIVDFLAERNANPPGSWSPFHYPETTAVDDLNRIVGRSSGVFTALRKFVASGRRLVILPGNHDIELNLPAVRNRLRQHVGAGRGGDYEFIGHGEAYRAGDVLIEHGNRVDQMNFVDQDVLRRLCGFLSRGMAVREEFLFDPPAGSKLVAQVINEIKKTYGFIDLLKPEMDAAFPVILALEPGRRRQLVKIANVLREGNRRFKERIRKYNTNISAKTRQEPTSPEPVEPDALEEILARTVGRADFGVAAVVASKDGTRDISAFDKARTFASLLFGHRDETWDHRLADLLDALRAFQGPNAFDRSQETEAIYKDEAHDLISGPVRHVIFGHTHLAKEVSMNGGTYFNSGTWADLLELPPAILDKTRQFAPLAELESLVRDLMANNFSPYVLFRPTFVRLERDANGQSISYKLCDYAGGAVT